MKPWLDSPYCLLEHVQRQPYEIFNVCFAQIAITQLSSLAGDILLSAIFLQITLMASYYNSLIWILFPIPLHFSAVSHIYLEQEFYLPPFHFYLPFSSIKSLIFLAPFMTWIMLLFSHFFSLWCQAEMKEINNTKEDKEQFFVVRLSVELEYLSLVRWQAKDEKY